MELFLFRKDAKECARLSDFFAFLGPIFRVSSLLPNFIRMLGNVCLKKTTNPNSTNARITNTKDASMYHPKAVNSELAGLSD